MVKNVVHQHSAVANVAMAKEANKEFFNGQEKLLANGFIRTFVLVEEYGSCGMDILEGSDLHCGGSDGNIWCCTRI